MELGQGGYRKLSISDLRDNHRPEIQPDHKADPAEDRACSPFKPPQNQTHKMSLLVRLRAVLGLGLPHIHTVAGHSIEVSAIKTSAQVLTYGGAPSSNEVEIQLECILSADVEGYSGKPPSTKEGFLVQNLELSS